MYGYGLIGNCQAAALIDGNGSIDWLCLPRPDSPPVFGKILDPEGGHFSIAPTGKYSATQSYLPNTNVLVTHFRLEDGSRFKITDFCPRFYQHGRMYRPTSLFRIVEPVSGAPEIRVAIQPVVGWEKTVAAPIRGNSHIRYEIRGEQLRVTTNMSLTHFSESTPVFLREPLYFALTWGQGLEDDLPKVAQQFLDQTVEYWKTWVKHCSIPSRYQSETIRSALALKLHCYEDTGAILAALTTSLPEETGSTRNWDYRYCWLRDSFFVLSALRNLGHFEEMEGFLTFLLGIARRHEHSKERLSPLYCLDQTLPIPERELSEWRGFSESRPVRINNQAAEHVQNDVYGEMILTLAPVFLDERFRHLRSRDLQELVSHLATLCVSNLSKADAGLWELRNGWQEHSFSNLMCWAGIDRVIKMREAGVLDSLNGVDLVSAKAKAEQALRSAVVEGSLRNGPKDSSFDAAMLQLPLLLYPDEELSRKTVHAISEELCLGKSMETSPFFYRYRRPDDFGKPKSAFLICSFWMVQALARVGRTEEASRVMEQTMVAANELGLFSEHFVPETLTQCGNFPQAYSHVGLINAAFAISPSWDLVL